MLARIVLRICIDLLESTTLTHYIKVSGELPEEYQKEREEMGFRGNSGTYKVENSSHAFAIVCFLMSAMNIGFAFIVVQFHENLYGSQGEENKGAREMEMQQTSNQSYTLHQI